MMTGAISGFGGFVRFVFLQGWGALLIVFLSVFAVTHDLPLFVVLPAAVAILAVDLMTKRILSSRQFAKERLQQLGKDLIRQENTFLARFLPLSSSEATFSIFHVARQLPSVTSRKELQAAFTAWHDAMTSISQNVMRDWLGREIQWLEKAVKQAPDPGLLSDAFAKFLSFVSRYHQCIEKAAHEIERAEKDSEEHELDKKMLTTLKTEYEAFRTEYDGFVHGFRIFAARLSEQLNETWQDGRIKTAEVLKQ